MHLVNQPINPVYVYINIYIYIQYELHRLDYVCVIIHDTTTPLIHSSYYKTSLTQPEYKTVVPDVDDVVVIVTLSALVT